MPRTWASLLVASSEGRTRPPVLGSKYRYLKWKNQSGAEKFDVHPGGRRDDWNHRVH